MGLDIRFISRKNILCPHCKSLVTTEDVHIVESDGHGWYNILEQLGYFVSYEDRTEENNWYGKDMTLTVEQAKIVYQFVKENPDLYDANGVICLIATAILDENAVVINADW